MNALTNADTKALAALERIRGDYGSGCADRKLALLERLRRTRLRSANAVTRLHEALCFLRAYPDDARVLVHVERMLAQFERRADLRAHREALADSGIAGTAIRYRFFWPTAGWIVRHWPDRLDIDRSESEIEEAIAALLPLLASPVEAEALRELGLPGFAALDRLRGKLTDAAFLVRRVAAMAGDTRTREQSFDAIDASFELRAGPDTPSRTHARHRLAPAAFQSGPLHRARPDLRTEICRAPQSVRELSPREGEQLISLARGAMITRARDLDTFAYGDSRDVRIVDDGGGLAFALNGVVPERRALLQAYYGGLMLRNGVPIGYLQADLAHRSAALSFNTFATFRGAEAARTFARLLAALHHLFGAVSFSIEPYQLGKDNDEGLDSGAWWFYYKMGFRPRAAPAKKIVTEELARMKTDPAWRSPRATLVQLAQWHLFFDLDPAHTPGLPSIAALGLRIANTLAARAGADRERAIADCAAEAMQLTGLRSLRGFSAGERQAWTRWSPLMLALPEVRRWSAADKAALVEVVRAKGGRSEIEYVARFAAHPKLAQALLGACRPGRAGVGAEAAGEHGPDGDRGKPARR